ncbi:hypothetical protein GCM10023238_21410 [Streptomyces heliomycini]
MLEDALGHPVPHLAYPHGYNSPRVRAMTARVGYETATAVRHALSSGRDERYRIARLIVRRGHTVADVEAWLAGDGARIAPYRDGPRTVGWRWYRRARTLLRGLSRLRRLTGTGRWEDGPGVREAPGSRHSSRFRPFRHFRRFVVGSTFLT